jgi:hypothetical protein
VLTRPERHRLFRAALWLAGTTIERFAAATGIAGCTLYVVLSGRPGVKVGRARVTEVTEIVDAFIAQQFQSGLARRAASPPKPLIPLPYVNLANALFPEVE